MADQNWKPLLRAPTSTVTKVLRSPAFLQSRERSAAIVEDPDELRALADAVERLDHANPPLQVVADRVVAAVRFLRARASRLDGSAAPTPDGAVLKTDRTPSAGVATRERLLVASLHYLVTPVDLVPDFQAGGYIDDVVLLAWVFGVATSELTPYLTDDGDADETAALDP
ncbi:MAG: hypothetical protein QOK15_2971 [Nocardioidaceae bacterium]|jgi:hypothetical protein|nr:hypothetical protein [Nocardioidaceae bacterium]